MARDRRTPLGPVIFPAVILVIALVLAVVGSGGIWTTIFLVVALCALALFLIALLNRLPGRRKR